MPLAVVHEWFQMFEKGDIVRDIFRRQLNQAAELHNLCLFEDRFVRTCE